MESLSLNGNWKLHWSTGQRGGMPYYVHVPPEPNHADVIGLAKHIEEIGYDEAKWMDAVVPGEVHQDLMRAGMIDSPYEQTGILTCRWVEDCIWFYRKVFDAPEACAAQFARLVFEGLDYGAVIYLNGQEIARHENAFYPCAINVSGLIKEKGNVLLVRLESGLFSACEKPARSCFTATQSMDVLLHKRNWLRKTQSQTEWDWSPRLLNIGIVRPVALQYSNSLIVAQVSVDASLDEDLTEGNIRIRVFSAMWREQIQEIKMRVTCNNQTTEFTYNTVPADGELQASLTMTHPKLWWPAGYGQQSLYDVEIAVLAGDKPVYSCVKKVGFRHVAVNARPHEIEGSYFVFEINRIPVFLRGSNLVPNDLLTPAMTETRYEKLVDLALRANFNFLRIWGGGLYENDALYELCDAKGIMLWQEFIAACGAIPIWDEKLLDSIKKEAVYHVRRLSSHPSLIAWCGNNEIEMAGNSGFMHTGDDKQLYYDILPQIIKREDPQKYYQPTSPFSADGSGCCSNTVGDQHPWDVGFTNKDSRDFEKMVCRFPNEGGILGPVSLPTMKACLRPGDGFHSFSWQIHDNMLESWMPGSSPDEDVRFWLNADIRSLSIEEYVFAGGLVQAEGLKRYIENFRRRKYSSSGAVFWMFNDCWPAVRSWTIVDYYMLTTPSYHPVRRAFSPVAPVIAKEDGVYRFFGVNDTLENWCGTVRFGMFTTDGHYLQDETRKVMLPANTSTVITELPAHLAENAGLSKTIVFSVLCDEDGNEISRTRYSDCLLFEMDLMKSGIRAKKKDDGWEFYSDIFEMGVCIDLNGSGDVQDNFFDIYPGQPYYVKSSQPLYDVPVLFTLNDFIEAQRITKREGKQP